jgi:hypothetical protein
MLSLRPHLEYSYSGELGCGQRGNAKLATAQPAACQHLMKATAQAPDRVSFGHTAILRALLGQARPDHPIIPAALMPWPASAERRRVGRRVGHGQLR